MMMMMALTMTMILVYIVVDFSCRENCNKCIKYGFQLVALVIWGDDDGNVEYGPDDDLYIIGAVCL